MGMEMPMCNFKTGDAIADHPCVVGMARVISAFYFPLKLFEFDNLSVEIGQPVLDARLDQIGVEQMCKTSEKQERAAKDIIAQRFVQSIAKGGSASLGNGIDLFGRFAVLMLDPGRYEFIVLQLGKRRINRAEAGFDEIGAATFGAKLANFIATRILSVEEGEA